jgi:cytochrome P450
MAESYLGTTASLPLFAGHETMVNLLANGMLALLRNPGVLESLRRYPELIPAAVDEMPGHDGPIEAISQPTTPDEIQLAGTVLLFCYPYPDLNRGHHDFQS